MVPEAFPWVADEGFEPPQALPASGWQPGFKAGTAAGGPTDLPKGTSS